jgi:predicted GH43/DUF377 family glycosyl hydrolase
MMKNLITRGLPSFNLTGPHKVIQATAGKDLTPICDYNDVTCLPSDKLINTMTYHYNCTIARYRDGYRIFYRSGNPPKMVHDRIATCLLTADFKIVEGSNKLVYTYSDRRLVMRDMKDVFQISQHNVDIFFSQHPLLVDGEHCEDPRVVEHASAWFLTYTDGFRVGVSKLDLHTCEHIYSHYLAPHPSFVNNGGDGREKNWIPFSESKSLCFLYSDTPRQILRYTDTGKSLQLVNNQKTDLVLECRFGAIRGGCPPVRYDATHMIWFFHTGRQGMYSIGAYITQGFRDVIHVLDVPILNGTPQPSFQTKLDIKSNVVYPCGAVATDSGWMISMGVNDYKVGLLHVKKALIETHLPADILSRIQNH